MIWSIGKPDPVVSEDDPETRYFSGYPGDFLPGPSSNDPSGPLCRVLRYLVKQKTERLN